jgi:hypothetical protein
MVTVPALLGNTFVLKAHAGPTLWTRFLSKLGLLRITYIYRDPRDAMLSAFDYGQRALATGRPNAFSHLIDFETSIAFMQEYLRIWGKWRSEKNVLVTRYEDLLKNYDADALRLVDFLNLDRSRPAIVEVIRHYRPDHAQDQQGLHFFKGKIGRFRRAYSASQQELLLERFSKYLGQMGYTP